MTGRAGTFGIGAMTIQTESEAGRPGDNYTVLRGRLIFAEGAVVGEPGYGEFQAAEAVAERV